MTAALPEILREALKRSSGSAYVHQVIDRWEKRIPPRTDEEALLRALGEALIIRFNFEITNLRQQMLPISHASNTDLDQSVPAGIYERAAEKLMIAYVEREKADARAAQLAEEKLKIAEGESVIPQTGKDAPISALSFSQVVNESLRAIPFDSQAYANRLSWRAIVLARIIAALEIKLDVTNKLSPNKLKVEVEIRDSSEIPGALEFVAFGHVVLAEPVIA